jgi:hypothetical protein
MFLSPFKSVLTAVALISTAGGLVSVSRGQCTGQWLPGTGVPGISGTVYASVMWDPDGAGPLPPVLVVGGSFTLADSTAVTNIAYWNGTSWQGLGAGLGAANATQPVVQALAVYNGSLVAGGTFTSSGATPLGSIARWNGSAWTTFSTGTTRDFGTQAVNALAIAPNGDLIAGGSFTTAGNNSTVSPLTVTVNRLARWNGTIWSAINPGNTTTAQKGVNGGVNAIAFTPAGDLVAAGGFTTAGPVTSGTNLTVNRIARWTSSDGINWTAHQLGSGLGASVNAVAVKSNGDIIAGGGFTDPPTTVAGQAATPSASYVIRWDNASSAWVAMDNGVGTAGTNDGNVRALTVTASGDVIAAGDFWTANGNYVGELARWNGTAWSAIWSQADVRQVTSLLGRADGSVVVGGSFKSANGVAANGVAVWDGTNAGGWAGVTSGLPYTSGPVTDLEVVAGWDILAGGSFSSLEGASASRVARLSGSMANAKSALGSGLVADAEPFPGTVVNQNPPVAFAKLPGGDIVCGSIDIATSVGGPGAVLARWNGTTWSEFTPALSAQQVFGPPSPNLGLIKSLAVLPDGELLAGGLFFLPDDPFSFHFLARFDGTQWQDMGIASGAVEKIVVKPNGHVIVAGDFTFANGTLGADYIADWDGTSFYGDGTPIFTPLGQGADGPVDAAVLLASGDLIVAGQFANVGNVAAGDLSANHVARWNGTAWSRLGSGMSDDAYALAVMPNGDIVAGGAFTASVTISGQPTTPAVNRLARWNGAAWSGFGSGLGSAGFIANLNRPLGSVFSLAVSPGGVLLVGGDFATAGGGASAYFARWADCTGSCCQTDGSCQLAAGSPTATCSSGTLVLGGSCSPNACPQPSGVCCRGATCNASVAAASCVGAGTAGAFYATSGGVCNTGGSTSTPCCYADYNKTGGVTVGDIFDYLNSWFAGSLFAKVGGDGTSGVLAVSDIFDFLNAWFAGGC